jgi:hypothetical protein
MFALQALYPAYKQSLDSYLTLTVKATKDANVVQLVLLLVLGVFMDALLSAWTWLNLQAVAELRYNVYQLFMVGTALLPHLNKNEHMSISV